MAFNVSIKYYEFVVFVIGAKSVLIFFFYIMSNTELPDSKVVAGMSKVKHATTETTYRCPFFIEGNLIIHACDGCAKIILPPLVSPKGAVTIHNRSEMEIIVENPTVIPQSSPLSIPLDYRWPISLQPQYSLIVGSSIYTYPLPKWKFICMKRQRAQFNSDTADADEAMGNRVTVSEAPSTP